MIKKIAFVAGGSGLVGMQVLHQLFKDPEYTYVISFGRRELAIKHEKLIQVTVDFERLHLTNLIEKIRQRNMGGDYHALIGWLEEKSVEIHGFCSLGTTIKKAGSRDAFYQIDHDYVVDFAQWAYHQGTSKFMYVSSVGANPQSSVFYSRVKGETEDDLKLIAFHYLAIFQPSVLLGNRRESRLGEEIGSLVMRGITALGVLKKYKPIYDHQVAKAMLIYAKRSSVKMIETVSNEEMHQL
ncbi:MAG: oxidoreductase [Lunatimonas sp.]|uniref:oxidoreductase n=1 Tax=Lunatimonas sp. TaxID=2060141 RepID=UPI00263A7CCF|nr:oxidoreductase [Lunatimonas sp.]MCC5935692.1 oxidoreductase [Lunatimonas sp.]